MATYIPNLGLVKSIRMYFRLATIAIKAICSAVQAPNTVFENYLAHTADGSSAGSFFWTFNRECCLSHTVPSLLCFLLSFFVCSFFRWCKGVKLVFSRSLQGCSSARCCVRTKFFLSSIHVEGDKLSFSSIIFSFSFCPKWDDFQSWFSRPHYRWKRTFKSPISEATISCSITKIQFSESV